MSIYHILCFCCNNILCILHTFLDQKINIRINIFKFIKVLVKSASILYNGFNNILFKEYYHVNNYAAYT